tara:strand:- start:9029 stop:9223 length:195 start_codon:yes stop_codon:yes gene_type:complete
MLPVILKLLTPTLIKTIIKYVTEENELDLAVKDVKKRLEALEKDTHPQRKLVCNNKRNKCKLVE